MIFYGEILDFSALQDYLGASWSGIGDRIWACLVRDQETARMYEEGFLHLSSQVALAIPLDGAINTRHPVGLPFRLLLRLVHALAELSISGIYLSGAVAMGSVCIGESNIWGPGLLDAQRSHARLAMYPRVIVAPDLLRAIERAPLLRREGHDAAEEISYIKRIISEDVDNTGFVDYLSAIRNEVDEVDEFLSFLRDHKLRLEEMRTRLSSESALPLHWLAIYHNRVVERVASQMDAADELRDELLVKPDPRFQHQLG